MFMPARVKDVQLYTGDEPIFDAYGIEDEISRALSRKVPLPSGGDLIIDQGEALTGLDVNTGRLENGRAACRGKEERRGGGGRVQEKRNKKREERRRRGADGA